MVRPRVHKDCLIFLSILLLASAFSLKISNMLAALCGCGAVWCLYFFRMPNISIYDNESVIISPASGSVVAVQEMSPPASFGMGEEFRTKVSIFLSVFDVHVNYIPVLGTIRDIHYEEGHFFHAGKDRASEHNEKNIIIIDTPCGDSVAVVQIAGLLARRIRCDVRKGDAVSTGQYYGLIRFGSRVEIFLPKGVKAVVDVGEKVCAGKTVLTKLDDSHLRKA
ncbi:MAG: phosphatidylserine decarboxylase [Holosporales bacterium]|nr:phosphatidylserine decarboxylase [Holosporales bacterium]